MPTAAEPAAVVSCVPMSASTRAAAQALLGEFLEGDAHYRASSAVYGDGGRDALSRALDLFAERPELGFVWLAFADEGGERVPVGACVVCHAISTSRGALALCETLRARGIARIDTACHRDNEGAWRFYERLGFRPLDEERIALLLD